jgi:hypothetical protein
MAYRPGGENFRRKSRAPTPVVAAGGSVATPDEIGQGAAVSSEIDGSAGGVEVAAEFSNATLAS